MRDSPLLPILVILTFFCAFSNPISAQTTYTWNNPNSGNWSNGLNWQGGTTPPNGPSTVIDFNNAGPTGYAASLDIANFTANALNFNNSSSGTLIINSPTGQSIVLSPYSGLPGINQNGFGNVSIQVGITLNATTTIGGSGSGVISFGTDTAYGGVAGTGALIINLTGGGTLAFNQNSPSWSGGLTLQAGNLSIGGAAQPLGTGVVTIQGGTLTYTSKTTNNTVTNAFNLAGGNLVVSGGPRFYGVISSTGNYGLVLTSGTAIVQNAMTYTGPTVVQGTPQLTSINPPGAGLNPGDLAGSTSIAFGMYGNPSSALFTSNVVITQGNVTVGYDSSPIFPSTAPVTLNKGAISFGTGAQSIGLISGSGQSSVTGGPSAELFKLTAAGLSRVTADSNYGTFNIGGGSDFGGPITNPNASNVILATPPVLIGGGGAVGTTTMSIVPYVLSGGFVTYTSATGILPLGAGEYGTQYMSATAGTNLALSGTSIGSVAIGQTINSLFLATGSTSSVLSGPSSATLTVNSGALLVVNSSNYAQTAAIAGFAAVNVPGIEAIVHVGTTSFTIGSPLTGATALTKDGGGTLILGANNSYSGTTTINAGLILFSAPSNLGASNSIVLAGGTLAYIGTTALTSSMPPIYLGVADGGLGAVAGSTWTPTQPITGSGGLFAAGAGTLMLTSPNSFSGGTTITLGTVGIIATSGLGPNPTVTFNSSNGPGASLQLLGPIANFDRNILDVAGGAILDTNGQSTTLTGLVSGTETGNGFMKTGAGTLTVNSPNLNIPLTTVAGSGSVLAFAGNGLSMAAGTITVANGGSLVLDNSSVDLASRLNGSSVQLSNGSLTLIGNSNQPTIEALGAGSIGIDSGCSGTITLIPSPNQSLMLTGANFNGSSLTIGIGPLLVRGTNLGATPGPGVATILFSSSSVQNLGPAGTPTVGILTGVIGDQSATGNGTDFVTMDPILGVRLLNSTEYATSIASGATVLNNVALTSQAGISAPTSINSLKVQGGGGVSGTGVLTLNAGAILSTGGANNGIAVENLTPGGIQSLQVYTASDLQIGGNIFGPVSPSNSGTALMALIKGGPNTLTVTGNLLESSVNVAAGTLVLSSTAYINPTATIAIQPSAIFDLGGTDRITGYLSGAAAVFGQYAGGTVELGSGTLSIQDFGASAVFGGVITGAGGLTRYSPNPVGGPSQTLLGVNTYTGPTNLIGNNLILAGPNGSIASTSVININGGVLILDNRDRGSAPGYNPARLGTAPVNLSGEIDVYANTVTPNFLTFGRLNLTGGGDMFLTSGYIAPLVLTFSVLNRLGHGTLAILNATSGNPGNGIGIAVGPQACDVFFSTAPVLSGSGAPGTASAAILPYVTVNGSLATYDPVVGLRPLANGETTPTLTANSTTANNILLTNTFTNSGTTTVNSIQGKSVTGSGTLIVTSGAVLNTSISPSAGQSLILEFGGTDGIIYASGQANSSGQAVPLVIGATVDGSGGLTIGGGSTRSSVSLTGTNTYSGGTFVNMGYLYFTADANLGSTSGPTAGGLAFGGPPMPNLGQGELYGGPGLIYANTSSNLTLTRPLVTNTEFAYIAVATSTIALNLAGTISGPGGLSIGDNSLAGTVVLSGSNSYTGPTRVTGGTLQISSDSNLGVGGDLIFNGSYTVSATLFLNGNWATNRNIVVINQGGNINTNGYTATVSGSLTGSSTSPLTKLGAGGLILSGKSSFPGTFNVSAGYVTAASDTALGIGSTVTVSTGAELQIVGNLNLVGPNLNISGAGLTGAGVLHSLSGTNLIAAPITLASTSSIGVDTGQLTLSGQLAGQGLTKVGAGTLLIDGSGTYPPMATAVNAGTLLVAIPSGTATPIATVQVNSGATLGGTGPTDIVTVLAGGAVAPGIGGTGVLSISGLVLNPGGAYIWKVNSWTSSIAGANYDQLMGSTYAFLDASALSPTNPFIIHITGLNAANQVGAVPGFNPSHAQSWVIAQFSNDLSSIPAQDFLLDTSNFSNNNPGGGFALYPLSNGQLLLEFTPVPEPRASFCIGIVALICISSIHKCVRRKRASVMTQQTC